VLVDLVWEAKLLPVWETKLLPSVVVRKHPSLRGSVDVLVAGVESILT
jgi:hypothetical protein